MLFNITRLDVVFLLQTLYSLKGLETSDKEVEVLPCQYFIAIIDLRGLCFMLVLLKSQTLYNRLILKWFRFLLFRL